MRYTSSLQLRRRLTQLRDNLVPIHTYNLPYRHISGNPGCFLREVSRRRIPYSERYAIPEKVLAIVLAITRCQSARGDLCRPFSGSSSQCFFGFDSELVTDGNPKFLLAAQIPASQARDSSPTGRERRHTTEQARRRASIQFSLEFLKDD